MIIVYKLGFIIDLRYQDSGNVYITSNSRSPGPTTSSARLL